ncbi:MAG: alanine--tRNA ligase [Bacteriovoracaceae bacterium]
MRAQEIREKFAQFFIKNGHEKHASSSLIPHNDPTILFANAGMNQFKDYFTGKDTPKNRRAVTIQKCVRAGGKHNDLENVGFTARHHTFFEMLGNFSFGDYFKRDAIHFAWTFLTTELKIPKEKLLVTVHESDEEALNIWHKDMGVPLEKIFKLGDKSNFWEMGDVGPCGPCTEIFFDHGALKSTGVPAGHQEIDDEGRYVEIWNLVFMQYEKYFEGKEIKRKSLPKPSVDTGAGLERIAAALQGKYWNYDSDIFSPILRDLEKMSGKKYTDAQYTSPMRVVADHIRSATMLITDGAIPSNEGRGYVLRRIIRRAVRNLRELGIKEVSFHKLVPAVFESLGLEYPDNMSNSSLAQKLLEMEERKFLETLDNGMKFLNEALEKMNEKILAGEVAFKLYDTYGFPLDLTEVILREKNLMLDNNGFDEAMKKQKENSKKAGKFQSKEGSEKLFFAVKEKFGNTKFSGYSETQTKNSKLIDKVELDGVTALIFDVTPFYGESGGQIGDTGEVVDGTNVIAHIDDTQKPVDSLWAHYSKDADALEIGKSYTLRINIERRELIRKNHSATHLLQSALIKVLGDHIKQAGSTVTEEKLRFDFSSPEALTKEQIHAVEKLVNEEIQKAHSVSPEVMSKDAAVKKGAMALFGEKYGDEVRVIEMGSFSTELCGGTHVDNTKDIAYFSILSESALSSGVRRIEGTTYKTAFDRLERRSQYLSTIEHALASKEEKAVAKMESLLNDLKDSHKKLMEMNEKFQALENKSIFENPEMVKGTPFKMAQASDGADLRKLSDTFVAKYPNGIVLLKSKSQDKVTVLLRAGKDAKLDCNQILKETLPLINGKGGGKADIAQGSAEVNTDTHQFETKTKELIIARLT